MPYKQSNPVSDECLWGFSMRSALDNSVQAALTFSGADLQILKTSGSYANAVNVTTVANKGGGDYVLQLDPAELNTPGLIMLKINKSGSIAYTQSEQVVRSFFFTVVSGTTTSLISNRTEATNDFWKDAILFAYKTAALDGQVKKTGAYVGSTKQFTLATVASVQLAWSSAPQAGDIFEILR